MKQTTLSVKRVGGYVVVISLLLLGSVIAVWAGLSSQLERQATDTLQYVSNMGPGLTPLAQSQTEITHSATSQDTANIVTIDNLSPPLVDWIEQKRAADLSDPNLLEKLRGVLGLPLLDIDSLHILDGAISLVDLDSTVNGLLDLAGTVADDSITSAKILNGTVDTVDLAADSVTSTILGALAVNAGHLSADSVTAAAILDGTVGSNEIADGAVGTIQLANNAITGAKVLDGEIGSSELADAAVGVLQLANDSVTTAKIADGTIGTSDVTVGAITSGLIQDGTINSNDIGNSAVTATQLGNGAITSAKILDGAILSDDIASSAITGNAILDGAITAADIASESIVSGLILNGSISTIDIASGAITSTLINDGTITSLDIATGTIGALQLASDAITSAKILDGTIGGGDIAAGAVGTTQLANSSVQTGKLSTASNKKTVSVQIGDIATIVGDTERPIFVAPTNGTITKVTFTNTLNISAGANKGILSVERKTATAATVASVDLGSISLTGFAPQSPTLSGGTSFNTGDVYSFKWDAGLIGVALTGFLVTIEYTPSE